VLPFDPQSNSLLFPIAFEKSRKQVLKYYMRKVMRGIDIYYKERNEIDGMKKGL